MKYCCFCGVHSGVRSVDLGFVGWGFVVSLHVGFCMLDYFVESHGGVKGDEQDHVAIRVEREPTCCDVEAVSGRSVAMCVDPQATITNRCDFRQCKSGKIRLFCSEDQELVACVSVHCKLVTRATQLGAYSGWGQEGVKRNLFSRSDQMRRVDTVPFGCGVSSVIGTDETRLKATLLPCDTHWKLGECRLHSAGQLTSLLMASRGTKLGGSSLEETGAVPRAASMPGAEVWL